MPSRKRSHEGRNLTAEKNSRTETGASHRSVGDMQVNKARLAEVRVQCTLEVRDRYGNAVPVYKHWLGGSAMEEILEVDDAMAIAFGLVEATRQGMRIEFDALSVLADTNKRLRKQVAEVFIANAREIKLSCMESDERLARYLEGTARRIMPKAKSESGTGKTMAKTEKLEAVVDRSLALGDVKAAAKAIAEAKLVDERVQRNLDKLNPEMARELAINLRRQARKMKGGKARFICALANRIEPMSATPPLRRDERRAA